MHVGRDHFSNLLSATGLPKDRFLAEYVPVAERLTLCVLDLPLMPSVFKSCAGALQCALQSGLLAVRMCDAQIFEPQATAQERQQNDPKWRWLAYCAALASVYLICAGNVRVRVNGNDFSFASEKPIGQLDGSFEASWEVSETRTDQAGLIYLQAFFYPGQFEQVPPSMLTVFAGSINPSISVSPHETPLARVVRTAISQVLDNQKKKDAKIIDPVPSNVYEDIAPEVKATTEKSSKSFTPPENNLQPENQEKESKNDVGAEVEKSLAQSSSTSSAPTSIVEKKKNYGMPPQVVEWIKALAHIRSMDEEITINQERKIKLSRKALGFGAKPSENYSALHDAGVIWERGSDFVWCDHRVTDLYAEEKELSIKK